MPFRVRTLQIAWHADEAGRNQPINGLDVHPTLPLLVTCSMDQKVHVWRIRPPPAAGAGAGDAGAAASSVAAAAPAAAGGAGAGAGYSAPAKPPQTEIDVEFLFALTGHMRTVNAVRFSPNGECLATASDDNTIIVWRPQGDATWLGVANERQTNRTVFRGHSADVYDLAWSPDSRLLFSGAVDRTARVWDVVKGREAARLEGHAQFVQGVAWEPAGHYVATQSNDRSVRIYRTPAGTAALSSGAAGKPAGKKGKGAGAGSSSSSAADGGAGDYPLVALLKWRDMSEPVAGAAAPAAGGGDGSVTATSSAGAAPAALQPAPAPADGAPPSPGGDAAEGAASSSSISAAAAPAPAPAPALASHGRHALFLDDTFPSFFRRLAWTPDGSLLLVPCGMYRAATGGAPPQFCSYAFDVRGGLAAAASPPTPSNPASLWPLAELPAPAHGKGTAVIRPCPVAFPIRANTAGGTSGAAVKEVPPHNGAFALPGYRLAYAVAALDSVTLWDSQAPQPIGVAASAHCDKITDMAWMPDGSALFVSSIDGYVSILSTKDVGAPMPTDDKAYPAVMKAPRPLVYLALDREKKAKQAAAAARAAEKAAAKAAAAAAGGAGGGAPTTVSSPAGSDDEGGGGGGGDDGVFGGGGDAAAAAAAPAAGEGGVTTLQPRKRAALQVVSDEPAATGAPGTAAAASDGGAGGSSPKRRALLVPVAEGDGAGGASQT